MRENYKTIVERLRAETGKNFVAWCSNNHPVYYVVIAELPQGMKRKNYQKKHDKADFLQYHKFQHWKGILSLSYASVKKKFK